MLSVHHPIFQYQEIAENLLIEKFIGKTYNVINKNKLPVEEIYKQKYLNKIVNLPNVSPNGAFYPKIENINEYNKIIKKLIIILDKTNI